MDQSTLRYHPAWPDPGGRGPGDHRTRVSEEVETLGEALPLYRLHTKGKVAKSLGNQARGVQPACTMTTQNSKISSIALKSRLIT